MENKIKEQQTITFNQSNQSLKDTNNRNNILN